MPSTLNLQALTLGQAIDLFKVEFRKRYPQSRFLLDGEGYEDEDIDLNIYVDGEALELERYAVEVSHAVQQATSYFILPFILPAGEHPTGA